MPLQGKNVSIRVRSTLSWAYKIVNKTKLPENRITYRLYLGEMPSTFLVPYLLDIRTHRSHVLAKILFAMSNSPNHRIVSPVKKKLSKQIKIKHIFVSEMKFRILPCLHHARRSARHYTWKSMFFFVGRICTLYKMFYICTMWL